jgi:transcriptional regulator with XRE-family HTH domain
MASITGSAQFPDMKDNIKLARQFRRFRKTFHFTQTELADLLGKSLDFVSDVENCKYQRINPKTHRLFLLLKERHETERRNKNATRNRKLVHLPQSNRVSGSALPEDPRRGEVSCADDF